MSHPLTIIVPTVGRSSLTATLASILPQLEPGDQLLVDRNADGDWGCRARNRMLRQARPGHALAFMDDDDTFEPGALAVIRSAFAEHPGSVHCFRCVFGDGLLWQDRVVREGNVSTQMFAVPQAVVGLAFWGDRYAGDYDFLASAVAHLGEPVWHEAVVSRMGGAVAR